MLAPHREVVLVDLPGHGESPPLLTNGRPALQVLLDELTGLFDELGLDRPHVAGNSLAAGSPWRRAWQAARRP